MIQDEILNMLNMNTVVCRRPEWDRAPHLIELGLIVYNSLMFTRSLSDRLLTDPVSGSIVGVRPSLNNIGHSAIPGGNVHIYLPGTEQRETHWLEVTNHGGTCWCPHVVGAAKSRIFNLWPFQIYTAIQKKKITDTQIYASLIWI